MESEAEKTSFNLQLNLLVKMAEWNYRSNNFGLRARNLTEHLQPP
jgi:hypothetical protein